MRNILKNLWLLFLLVPVFTVGAELPELLPEVPAKPLKTLGPVGAGAKDVPQAREQLRREAAKMDADAVVAVSCEAGGIKRYGLSWAKETAYCRGMAVKYESMESNQK